MDHNSRPVFLFSHPRTCSNLFYQVLTKQSDWMFGAYHFQEAFIYAWKSFRCAPLDTISEEHKEHYKMLLEKSGQELHRFITCATRQGKQAFIKNHSMEIIRAEFLFGTDAEYVEHFLKQDKSFKQKLLKGNPFTLSDELLMSCRPIILIRHPALTFESWYRAESECDNRLDINDFSAKCHLTFGFSRLVYEWFTSRKISAEHKPNGTREDELSWPVVLDADDIIQRNDVLTRFCQICDMDPASLSFQWEIAPIEHIDTYSARHKRYNREITNSTSIDRNKAWGNSSFEMRASEWRTRFGDQVADLLIQRVTEALPDYEYLHSRRLKGVEQ